MLCDLVFEVKRHKQHMCSSNSIFSLPWARKVVWRAEQEQVERRILYVNKKAPMEDGDAHNVDHQDDRSGEHHGMIKTSSVESGVRKHARKSYVTSTKLLNLRTCCLFVNPLQAPLHPQACFPFLCQKLGPCRPS